ncbi:MAG TPA: hypothetical protein VG432_11745 [Gemmatimonadaceae bacterium]|nr:hypothetical protein [Gemmatimonadaceae bacterium]
MKGVQLVHDVLDAQLVDRERQKMGRVDGLVIEIRDGEPPRVAALLVGGSVLAERVGRWMIAITHRVSRLIQVEPEVTRIPFERVRVIGSCVELDLDARETNTLRTERWLDDHIVCRIPGGAGPERK